MMTRVLITMLTACLLSACHLRTGDDALQGEGAAADSIGQMVMQVKQCSRLYTTEYKIHKIVTHDDVIRLQGNILQQGFDIPMPLGDRKIAIPMDATLKAYVDLGAFSADNVVKDGKRIIVILPDPQIMLTSTKINQRGIKEYVGLVRSHFSDAEMSNYEQQGRQAIIESIPNLGIIRDAQENATRLLVPLICRMGYKEQDITIQFRKEFGINDMQNIVRIER